MNESPAEERIEELAYRLWEEAGSPDGRSDEFWHQAQRQLAKEPGIGSEAERDAVNPQPPTS
ncbi:DUF2934 domain-containing protein [Caballeronia sp. LZ035]|uniref:DUF2934 domain-containing protein n=1 Tax=Caballeronia sp. LZ035 TaxID=3038568 RepID=UPI00285E94D9|nr:DUF2934 domain-containing protein [Caballeronia sp. LZ035]MDR5763221.1 DUF2934 domain-containing protein [Caballeronia sp. LZ035]